MQSNQNSFYSPAKLNLFFRVLYKRSDGYHEIASLYQAIDLFDRLFFTPEKSDTITCTDRAIPLNETNLVYKALALFRVHHKTPKFHIHIEKNIPVQAGLGGGSSNAATTLWALNELMGKPFSLNELIKMGAQIGSDVPFFFSSGSAYCTGRGEIIEPFVLPKPLEGYLAKPKFGLSTPLVYSRVSPKCLQQRDPKNVIASYPNFFNDLEIASFEIEPRLNDFKSLLQRYFKTVVMTGSGTAFFCCDGKPPESSDVRLTPFSSIAKSSQDSWFTQKMEK